MIYIVTTDDFEEYAIEGVFDSKEKAELWIKLYGYEIYGHKKFPYKVEEYPLNPGIAKLQEITSWLDKDGNNYCI